MFVDACGFVGAAAVADGDLAALEVADELGPFGVGGGAVFRGGAQRAAACDEGAVAVDHFLGVDGLVSHGGVDVAVAGDELGDVRWHAMRDGVGDEQPSEVVEGVAHVGDAIPAPRATSRATAASSSSARSLVRFARMNGCPMLGPCRVQPRSRRPVGPSVGIEFIRHLSAVNLGTTGPATACWSNLPGLASTNVLVPQSLPTEKRKVAGSIPALATKVFEQVTTVLAGLTTAGDRVYPPKSAGG